MRRFALALTAASLLSFTAVACSGSAPETEATAEPAANATAAAGDAASIDAAPKVPPSDAATPKVETPPIRMPIPDPVESAKGEKGARGVLLTWARAIEFGRYGEAWRQWGDGGARSGLSEADHAAQFAPYRRITIGFGDGEVEGAAGSLYYQVPVDFTGERKAGGTVKRTGTIYLRRVNDVDGATPEQREWHIERTTLKF